jgi:hypothetical protein
MMLLIWYITMLALLWSVFYRATIANQHTHLGVRLGLFGMSAAALAGMAAPLYGWQPNWVTLGIVGVIVYAQMVFAGYWRTHVPGQYLKTHQYRHRRRTDPPEHHHEPV